MANLENILGTENHTPEQIDQICAGNDLALFFAQKYQEAQKQLAELQAQYRSLEKQSSYHKSAALEDALTKLGSRRAFEQDFPDEKRETTDACSLLILDFDNFKSINDTYGHQGGDNYLRYVSKCISEEVLRKTDKAYRWGGDEIAVLCFNTPLEGGIRVAEKIRGYFNQNPITINGDPIYPKFSIGVTDIKKGDDKETAFKRADACTYLAKQAGKDCIYSSNDLPK